MEVTTAYLKVLQSTAINVMYVPHDMNLSFLNPTHEFKDQFLFGMMKILYDDGFDYEEQNKQMLFQYKWDRAFELYKKSILSENNINI